MAIDKYTLKDGTTKYRATTYVQGQRVQKRGFRTKRDAQKWIDKTRVEGRLQTNLTYGQMCELFLAAYQPTVKPATYYNMVRNLGKSRDKWEHTNVANISARDAQDWVNQLAQRYTRPSQFIVCAKQVFAFCLKNDLIARNPMTDVLKPKERSKEKEIWTPEQLALFLDQVEHSGTPMDLALFRLAAYTGLRMGELLALEWGDIDRDLLTVSKTITKAENGSEIIGPPKSRASAGTLALDRQTVAVLKEWRRFAVDKRVFPITPPTVNARLRKYAELADLPRVTMHSLRHLHCTMLINAGAQIRDVQERLGHSDITTTLSIYTHANKDKHAAIDKLFSTSTHTTTQA